MQVQANVQTVLEGLGLVNNKTAQQDAAALKEVRIRRYCISNHCYCSTRCWPILWQNAWRAMHSITFRLSYVKILHSSLCIASDILFIQLMSFVDSLGSKHLEAYSRCDMAIW